MTTQIYGGRILLMRTSDGSISELGAVADAHADGRDSVVHVERDGSGVVASIEYPDDYAIVNETDEDSGEVVPVRSHKRLDTEHASLRATLAQLGHTVEPDKPGDLRPGRGRK